MNKILQFEQACYIYLVCQLSSILHENFAEEDQSKSSMNITLLSIHQPRIGRRRCSACLKKEVEIYGLEFNENVPQ